MIGPATMSESVIARDHGLLRVKAWSGCPGPRRMVAGTRDAVGGTIMIRRERYPSSGCPSAGDRKQRADLLWARWEAWGGGLGVVCGDDGRHIVGSPVAASSHPRTMIVGKGVPAAHAAVRYSRRDTGVPIVTPRHLPSATLTNDPLGRVSRPGRSRGDADGCVFGVRRADPVALAIVPMGKKVPSGRRARHAVPRWTIPAPTIARRGDR